MLEIDRPIIRQDFISFAIQTDVVPVQLAQAAQQSSLSSLVTSILLSVPTGGTDVWLGGSSVSAALSNGLLLPPGVPVNLVINNDGRQLYELQDALMRMLACPMGSGIAIPFTCWDVATIYLAGTAPQAVGCILFTEGFI